ncbi:hypothetical protein Taro_002499 [Colocasia esculenta]|uniref:Uncharacterized protein n=1 Tax=Colocasia esculenta TaxID=4460 RepID=A0A843TJD0_COLES|nr:hypothetical protein [Colocasia esculenta]
MALAQPYLPIVGLLPIIPLRPELGIITHKNLISPSFLARPEPLVRESRELHLPRREFLLQTTQKSPPGLERSEAPVPWPAEEQEDENPQLRPSEEKATSFLSRSRRRRRPCRVQEKGRRRCICRFTSSVPLGLISALLVWVRRRHPARRHQGSDAAYVAIRRRREKCRDQEGDRTIVAIRHAVCPYTYFLWLSVVRACEESDGVVVAAQKATGY